MYRYVAMYRNHQHIKSTQCIFETKQLSVYYMRICKITFIKTLKGSHGNWKTETVYF